MHARCTVLPIARQSQKVSCLSSKGPMCGYLLVSRCAAKWYCCSNSPSAGMTTSKPLWTKLLAALGAHIRPETSTTATLHSSLSPSSCLPSSSPSKSLVLLLSSSILLATSNAGNSSSILPNTSFTPVPPVIQAGPFPAATCLIPSERCTSCEMGNWRT